ncbi:MAG: rhodanese-like domain-containing protein [Bdellovibrionaceae bacterium]|nr:rhodanese-like domain-containing protein [Pseudobdellovibrionaceae bacterium]
MPLGLFQFLNLLRQRVHFFVFAWASFDGLDIKGMEKMHLDHIVVPMTGEPDLGALKTSMRELKLEPAAPILLIDGDGVRAREIAQALDEESYINVFYALDGVSGFLSEKQASLQ